MPEVELENRVAPRYPAEAKAARIQGTIRFEAAVDSSGKIVNLGLLSGPLALYDASREAVLAWRYKAAGNSQLVPFSTEIKVNYTLSQ